VQAEGDTVLDVGLHALENLAGQLDGRDDGAETGGEEDDVGGYDLDRYIMSLHLFFGSFLSIGGIQSNLFVILLQGSEIFSGFREFSFFHSFSDIPVDESSLGVHEIELVINSREDFSDGSGVGKHEKGSVNLGKISSGNSSGGLVVDSTLESSGTPINKLDGSLSFHGSHGRCNILRNDISSEHEAAGHVLSSSRITLGHHVGWLKDRAGEIGNCQLFVMSLLLGDDGSVRAKHEMDSGVGDQVGLEFVDVNVQ